MAMPQTLFADLRSALTATTLGTIVSLHPAIVGETHSRGLSPDIQAPSYSFVDQQRQRVAPLRTRIKPGQIAHPSHQERVMSLMAPVAQQLESPKSANWGLTFDFSQVRPRSADSTTSMTGGNELSLNLARSRSNGETQPKKDVTLDIPKNNLDKLSESILTIGFFNYFKMLLGRNTDGFSEFVFALLYILGIPLIFIFSQFQGITTEVSILSSMAMVASKLYSRGSSAALFYENLFFAYGTIIGTGIAGLLIDANWRIPSLSAMAPYLVVAFYSISTSFYNRRRKLPDTGYRRRRQDKSLLY
jgi:hypothetical protein